MMIELVRCLRFELRRLVDPIRALLCIAMIACAISSGYDTLEQYAMVAQSTLEGSVAQDVFYATLNSEWAVGLYLPAAIGALCIDMVGRDVDGAGREAVFIRLAHRQAWWVAKVVAIFACSLLVMAATQVFSTAYDALIHGMPMSTGAIPAWLGFTGEITDIPTAGALIMRPLPRSWNILAFDAALIAAYGAAYSVLIILIEGCFMRVRSRWAAAAAGISIAICNIALEGVADIAFSYGAVSVEVRALPIYRLMLSAYPFGAGFTTDRLFPSDIAGDPFGATSLYMNSFSSTLLIIVLLAIGGISIGALHMRKWA